MPRETAPSIDSFLKSALRSGLLDEARLAEARGTLPADERDSAQALALHLIKTGKLTRFQAAKLLQGVALGLVLGHFQVLAPIGKGGMGHVYLARDSRSSALVALKVLPPKRARQEEHLLARFRREMNLSKMLNHPHLAKAYDSGDFHGVYYIAMEFIPGKSLYRHVSAGGPLAVPHAARLFAEVADGISYAHSMGLIHRDLKPSNIMITPNDHAKVLDVGLAIMQGEMADDRTIVGGKGYVVGTMDYLAPEQAEDSLNVDGRADIYAMGCAMYFVVTGRPPFPGGNALQKIMRHLSEEPTPASQLNPAVPPEFDAVLARMMAKRLEQRFENAHLVRMELTKWAAGEPVLPPDTQNSAEWKRAVTEIQLAEIPAESVWADIVNAPRPNGQPAADAAVTSLFDAKPAGSIAYVAWHSVLAAIHATMDHWVPVLIGLFFLLTLLYVLFS